MANRWTSRIYTGTNSKDDISNKLTLMHNYYSITYNEASYLLTLFFPSNPFLSTSPFFLSPTFAHTILPRPYFTISSLLPLLTLLHPVPHSSLHPSYSALYILYSILLSPLPFSSQATMTFQLSSETGPTAGEDSIDLI